MLFHNEQTPWPRMSVVKAALNGIGLATPAGPGVRSLKSWVLFVTTPVEDAPLGFAACTVCLTTEPAPLPPSSRGLNGKPEPLFGTKTKDYALFLVSSFLNPFYKKHSDCAVVVEEGELEES